MRSCLLVLVRKRAEAFWMLCKCWREPWSDIQSFAIIQMWCCKCMDCFKINTRKMRFNFCQCPQMKRKAGLDNRADVFVEFQYGIYTHRLVSYMWPTERGQRINHTVLSHVRFAQNCCFIFIRLQKICSHPSLNISKTVIQGLLYFFNHFVFYPSKNQIKVSTITT